MFEGEAVTPKNQNILKGQDGVTQHVDVFEIIDRCRVENEPEICVHILVLRHTYTHNTKGLITGVEAKNQTSGRTRYRNAIMTEEMLKDVGTRCRQMATQALVTLRILLE